jgi:uncharacterized protein (TIGR04255 family)
MEDKETIVLSKPPLVEVVFDLRWKLETKEEAGFDQDYELFVFKFYDKIKSEYPLKELSSTSLPPLLLPNLPRLRFRRGGNESSCVQIGPGVVVLNEDPKKYVWYSFYERICALLDALFDINADIEFKPENIFLRYVDSMDCTFASGIYNSLKLLNIDLTFKDDLFKDNRLRNEPLWFSLKIPFPTDQPDKEMLLKFYNKKDRNPKSFTWETIVIAPKDQVPQSKEDIIRWVEDAHNLTHEFFFKMIDGDYKEKIL